jgi:hypothetical protein
VAIGDKKKAQDGPADDLMKKPGIALSLDRLRVLLYGQPKVGKTSAAYTISELWDGKMPSEKGVFLEDCFSLSADRNATLCMRAAGINMHEFDVREVLSDGRVKNVRDALAKV